MNKIKILCIEDSESDFMLLQRTLERAGFAFETEWYTNLADLRGALQRPWDILLSDYHLGSFTGIEVLKTALEIQPELPVIVVSGAIREEDAVDLMHLGAKDFVRKDNTSRLIPAIQRELRESAQRRARVAAEAALQNQREFTSRILDSTEDSILVLNREGRVITTPAGSGAGLHSLDGKAALGENFGELWPRSQDKVLALEALTMALQGRVGRFIGEQPLAREMKAWSVVVTPIYESHAEPTHLLVVARDVTTERRQTEELRTQAVELQKALVQAESANQMKTAFLANMSHEIRTPIGAMMGFSEFFADPGLTDDERTEFLAVIKRNGETVLRLLNEILDLSKIEAGHLEIEPLDVSLQTLVGDVVADARLKAESKGLDLYVSFSSNLKSAVRTDPTRLKQILTNLLGNAIKFTEKGSVRLAVSQEQKDNQELIKFQIEDTGIGIRAEDQLKLFKPFSQGDSSLTRRFGGTGLGLALSKRLAQALGGDVVIHSSQPDVGTVFVASICNHGAVSPVQEGRPAQVMVPAREKLRGVRVLVADDSVDNQELLQRLLDTYGASVDVASTGVEAIEKALRTSPHVVLMDLQMPVMDGMMATQALRSQHFDQPIVAITAHAMKENKEECLEKGFNGYVSKPINFTELINLVESLAIH